jgi:hypothetical protein
MVWIHLAQYKAQWQALMNTVMNLRVPHKEENLSIGFLSMTPLHEDLFCFLVRLAELP